MFGQLLETQTVNLGQHKMNIKSKMLQVDMLEIRHAGSLTQLKLSLTCLTKSYIHSYIFDQTGSQFINIRTWQFTQNFNNLLISLTLKSCL
jgi:hypothetical protein